MSLSTPIRTTSSEIWALAVPPAAIRAAAAIIVLSFMDALPPWRLFPRCLLASCRLGPDARDRAGHRRFGHRLGLRQNAGDVVACRLDLAGMEGRGRGIR